jgi:hypothetical protein
MTTPRLREELQRIGDGAAIASVPVDTWTRARSARRRNLAAAVAASAASIAVVAGLAFGATGEDKSQPPVTDPGTPGVPDRIEAVPAELTHRDGDGLPTSDAVSDDLAVGPAAVVFLAGDSIPVVIGATDGRYHLLDLPEFNLKAVTLSPSGELLAYSSKFGVRILDLTTGELRSDVDTSVMLPEGQPADVLHLDWSGPYNDGLVYAFGYPDSSGVANAGRILVDSNEPFPGDSLNDPEAIWASNALGGFVGSGAKRAVYHDGQVHWKRGITSPGVPVALRSGVEDVYDVRRDGDSVRMFRHDTDTDVELALPADFPADATVVAWLGESQLLVSDGSRLLMVTYGDNPALTQVGDDSSGSDQLRIATELLADGQPTVHRPEPDWP